MESFPIFHDLSLPATECRSGTEWDSAVGECVPCRIGYYRNSGSHDRCVRCQDPDYITSQEGATSDLDCDMPVGSRGNNKSFGVLIVYILPQRHRSREQDMTVNTSSIIQLLITNYYNLIKQLVHYSPVKFRLMAKTTSAVKYSVNGFESSTYRF